MAALPNPNLEFYDALRRKSIPVRLTYNNSLLNIDYIGLRASAQGIDRRRFSRLRVEIRVASAVVDVKGIRTGPQTGVLAWKLTPYTLPHRSDGPVDAENAVLSGLINWLCWHFVYGQMVTDTFNL